MAFIPVLNTVEAHLRFTQGGAPAENVVHLERTGGYTQSDLDTLSLALADFAADDMLPVMHNQTVFVEVYVKGMASQADLQSTDTTHAGESGAVSLPQAANVSKAFTLRSGLTGRSQRGRMFWIGMSSNFLTNPNTVTQGFVDDVIGILEALKALVEALGWVWVIVSKYTNGAPRTTGQKTPIAGFGVSGLDADSMRSRLLS